MTKNKETVKIGIVGCGDVALDNYLPTSVLLRDEGKVELVAVCDTVEVRAKTVQKMFNVNEYYTSYEKMLDKADINAVINLTPHKLHAPLSLQAIEAGKHVYCEKPMCEKLEDANAIVKYVKKANIKFACAPAILFNKENIKTREIISKGLLGKIAYVRAFGSSAGPMESVGQFTDARWYYEDTYGPLLTRTIYTFHSLANVMGSVKRVSAFSATSFPKRRIENLLVEDFKPYNIEHKTPDNYMIILDWGNDTLGFVDGTYCCKSPYDQSRWDAEYYGSDGILYMNEMTQGLVAQLKIYFDREIENFPRGWLQVFPSKKEFKQDNLSFEELGLIHWVNCIRNDEQPLINAENARHIIEIAIKVVESANTGEAQTLTTSFNLPPLDRLIHTLKERVTMKTSKEFGFGKE